METQKISETLVEGSVDYKPVLSQTPDGKTLEKVSVVSSLSESGAVSESVTVTEVPSGVGNANVHKNIENVVDGTELELMGVGFEQKVVDGYDNIDSEGVKSDEKLANVDYNNGLESVDTEQKLVDGQGTVESENKLANVDDYNDLEGVEIENKFGDVDDTIDLEALGLENEDVSLDGLMEGGTLKHGTQESGAEFNESLDNGVEKIGVADAVEDIDTSKVHVNDSPTKIEVSGNGISLTVDVFGPDCTFYMETDNPMGVNGNEAEGNVSDNQEHNFAVGDLVWVKMKTDLWWPGMICDPHTTKDAGKCNHMDGFFVKHFGNTSSVWCRPFQLKPFIGYFELMSRQNKSRSFYAAIEKALGEFGRRVKQEMTCSCFSKENQVAAQNFPSKEDENGGSVFSASQFEPSNLLEFIKSRALGLRSPGNVEFTVAENCLSAFYTSIGHKQLPLYKLRPTNNLISVSKDEDLDKLSSGDSVLKSCRSGSDDIKMTEMELSGSLESPRGMRSMISRSQIANENAGGKSFESRERKKSKYLSYPYVNSWASRKNSLGQGEDETEDCEEVTPGGGKTSSNPSVVSTSIGNNSNKTSLRKSRKSVNDNDICNNADFGAASSAEMLQELHQTALDCFYPIQSTCPIPIRDFYLSFRAFRDPEVQMDEYKEATLGCQETLQSDNILASGGYDLQVEGQPLPNVLPKKRGRKKSDGINATGPKFSSKTNLPRMTADGTSMNGSPLIDSVQTGPDTLKKGVVHRQRKKAAIAAVVHNEIGVLGGLPDLNVNNAGLSVENMQVIGPAPTQGKLEPKRRRRKKEELVSENLPDVSKGNTQFIPMLKSVEVTGSLPLEGGPQPDNMFGVQGACSLPNTELLAGQSNANEIHAAGSSLPNISQITGLVSSAKAEGKKRKRKEKALNIQNNSSALPDLNGQVTDPNLKGKEVTEMSCVSGQAKPKQKRRRATKSAAIGIPNPNGDHNTLLLYFTPGSPVPSKEYITATFASFGPLEESKTLYLNDSTAQVVFEKDSDAMEALQSLQSRNPFGPSLVSYRLRHVSTCNNTQTSVDALQSPSVLSGGEGPDLVVIKQNLESMTTMLEKAGDNISPEMKAKLESEVKGFLEKVSNMVGSSSS
ncbi:uncharacterized protein LOC125872171 isoform X2 [Solanum stenotomum]|uniref:uncharacterized protein LOC125872171 isoform X2 n=1 Tax=Solanum stenotomum TaxID=172797 RepID=UPI0020D11515|nr:uncharacterized protein LOC125872171 isoform X2 [Solanum stenotomum]